jgi:hypothetical protein
VSINADADIDQGAFSIFGRLLKLGVHLGKRLPMEPIHYPTIAGKVK